MKLNKLNEQQIYLLSLIPRGEANAMPVGELVKITKYKERVILSVISELIFKKSIPIVASRGENGGIYIPQTQEELTRGLKSYKKQVKTMERRIEVVEGADIHIVEQYEEKYPKAQYEQGEHPYINLFDLNEFIQGA